VHAHTKDLTIVTFDDEEKPNKPAPFFPVDPLGFYQMGALVPVDWVAVPSGSKEMAEVIPRRLEHHRVTVIQGHGAFVKARSLEEALWLACISNHSGYIVRLMEKLGVDVGEIRNKVKADPEAWFSYAPDDYTVGDNDRCDFPEEEELIHEFRKAGARIFESRLSPFHTGSLSVRGIDSMLYAPKGAMPRDLSGPLLEVPLENQADDSREIEIHKALYAESNFQTIAHCYVPEAEVLANFIYPGEEEPDERIVPIDAEGSFLYLVVPVVPAKVDVATMVELLHDYKVVIVRGGGVWGAGTQSLSEVLHHPSSVREICLYRIGAFERGLNLRTLEPEKAKRW
jgi:ribulose-5-phosphate 4-epimerase/fuculose-1-phosphate aldolase